MSAYASESITISSTAIGFTASVLNSGTASKPQKAVFVVEDANIRFTVDGSTPIASVGMPAEVGEVIIFDNESDIRAFRAIRSGSSDATIQPEFFDNSQQGPIKTSSTSNLRNASGTQINPATEDTLEDIKTIFTDSAALDAFQRLRTTVPVSVFENKNIHDRSKSQWEEPLIGAIIVHGAVAGGPFQVAETITGGTSGTVGTVTTVDSGFLIYTVNHNDFVDGETITGGTSGATATVTTHNTGSDVYHDRDTASVILQVGQVSGDIATRQTHRYFSYIPGKSHEVWLTFNFGAAVTNLRRRSGYFNGENGIYLEQTTSGISWNVLSNTSGSPVVTSVSQSAWNLDKLDGTGTSGITLDFTKSQFLIIDFQWQGDGRIRVGFFNNGIIRYCHEFLFSNTLSSVYMSTPSLPVKHEIENTEATTSPNTMREFCTSIVSQGGENPTGLGFSVSNDVTARTINNAAESPVLAIRLKNVHPNGGDNRVVAKLSNATFFATTNSAHFEIFHVHDPSSITATWSDVGGGSAVEFSTDISAITGNPGHPILEEYVASGQAGKGGTSIPRSGDIADQHRFLTQNFDSTNSEVFVVFGEAITGNAAGYATISWVEFD